MHVATITIEVWCFLLGESRLNHCFSFCILTWNWHKFLLPRSIELLIMQVLGSYIFLVHKSLALNHVSPLHNTVSTHNILPYVLFSFTFVYMSFYHNDTIHEDVLCVSWLCEHPERKSYGSPLELWWKDLYETEMLSFIPIQCLLGNCSFMDTKYEEQTLSSLTWCWSNTARVASYMTLVSQFLGHVPDYSNLQWHLVDCLHNKG